MSNETTVKSPPFSIRPPILSGRTVLASYLVTILDAALQAAPGLNADDLLAQAGIDPNDLSQPDSRVPLEYSDRLWAVAWQETGDTHFGLHVGEEVRPGSFNVIGQLLMTCSSLAESMDKAVRYADFIGQGARPGQYIAADGIALCWEPAEADWQMADHRIDAFMTATLIFARWISNHPIVPIRVKFRRPAPDDASEYGRIFGCDITFGADENSLIFSHEDLGRPPREANAALHSFLDDHVAGLQADHQKVDMILYRLRQAMQSCLLEGGEPVIDLIAPRLGLSARSLQRRLKDNNASFRKELARIRQDMACYWLQTTDQPLQQISDKLGFAELAVFSRAFKLWTGLSPNAWRQKQRKSQTP